MKVIVDTSLLMLSAELGKNLIEMAEYTLREKLEVYVIEDVVKELERLSRTRGKKSMIARVALHIARNFKILPFAGDEDVDEKIVKAAGSIGAAIATVDAEMIKKAREAGTPTLVFHKDLRVSLEGVRS